MYIIYNQPTTSIDYRIILGPPCSDLVRCAYSKHYKS